MREFLASKAENGLLPWGTQVEAAQRFGLGLDLVEERALEQGVLPARYARNRETLSLGDQLALLRSRVAVIGCGGLGGYLIEEMARLGVGTLVLVDPDCFEEHNLNRQLMSSPAVLGKAKVEVAAQRVEEINPVVKTLAFREAFSSENGQTLLQGCSAAADGLDSLGARRALASVCREMGIPLVHGAIAGWYGQVAVQLPGDDLSAVFRREGKGMETRLGNPAFTPAVVASLQVAELTKVLLGRQRLRGMLFLDLASLAFEELPLG